MGLLVVSDLVVYLNYIIYLFSCYMVRHLFFFFFKQKTAYEMRISDWSSDVCSSDLSSCRGLAGQHEDAGANHRADAQQDQLGAGEGEIGRASCRERVCQYV